MPDRTTIMFVLTSTFVLNFSVKYTLYGLGDCTHCSDTPTLGNFMLRCLYMYAMEWCAIDNGLQSGAQCAALAHLSIFECPSYGILCLGFCTFVYQ